MRKNLIFFLLFQLAAISIQSQILIRLNLDSQNSKNKFDSSIKVFDKYDIYLEIANKNRKKILLNLIEESVNISKYYLADNKNDSALFFAMIAFNISSSIFDDTSIEYFEKVYFASKNFAEVYQKTNNKKALKYYVNCLNIIKESNYGEEYPFNYELYLLYLRIANLYEYVNNYDRALHYYNLGILYTRKLFGYKGLGLLYYYYHLGRLYHFIGDYSEARKFYEQALVICDINGCGYIEIVGYLYNNLGIIYQDIGELNNAFEYYQKTLVFYNKFLDSNDYEYATIYNNLAEWFNEKGNFQEALNYYNKSLFLKMKYNGKNSIEVANIYNNIGLLYYNFYDYKKSLFYHFRSLNIRLIKNPMNHPTHAQSYYNIGLVYLKEQDFDKALQMFQKSLIIYAQNFTDTVIYHNPSIFDIGFPQNDVFLILIKKAEALFEKYKSESTNQLLTTSLKTYYLAFKLNEINRNELLHEESKIIYSKKIRDNIGDAILVSFELYKNESCDINDVLFLFEESKAQVLLSKINELNVRKRSNIPKYLLLEEKNLRSKITTLKNYISNSPYILDTIYHLQLKLSLNEIESKYD
ncbi:tetratricopeptide repeat protein, partial [candidate division KSB1 bacterium]